jgi:hypothetical protein
VEIASQIHETKVRLANIENCIESLAEHGIAGPYCLTVTRAYLVDGQTAIQTKRGDVYVFVDPLLSPGYLVVESVKNRTERIKAHNAN